MQTAEPFCGGSIITSSHILTAAHCTFDSKIDDVKEPEAIQVLVGMHRTSDLTDVKILGVSAITNHPKFNNNEGDYDYSILTLKSPITPFPTPLAAPVCLPPSISNQYTSVKATVIGWGDTSSDGSPATALQEAEVTVISDVECEDKYPGKIERYL